MELSRNFKLTFCLCFAGVIFACGLFADSSYVVKKGDTLYSISRRYEITVAELRTANNLSESDVLKEGQKLIVPTADIRTAAVLSSSSSSQGSPSDKTTRVTSYVIQKGDTLYGIARKYDIKLPELLAMNNLDTNATIKVGQKISVPAVASAKNDTAASENAKTVTKTASSAQNGKASASEKALPAGSVVWPIANPVVRNINGKVSGVQLSGKDSETVKCVREGTVMYTGVYRGFGEVVFVQSKTGLIYSYTGLGSVSAKKGEYVIAGSELGKTGSGSESSIKFMVFQNGTPIDPAKAPRG